MKNPNAKTLRRIREQRSLSTQSVATALNTSENVVKAHESGDKFPTMKQLSRLSYIYGVPEYVLLGENIPNLEENLADFRTEYNKEFSDSPLGLGAILKRQDEANLFAGLAESLSFKPLFFNFKDKIDTSNLPNISDEVARQIKFYNEDKFLSNDPVFALRYLRKKIEDFGIFTLAVDTPIESYRGVYKSIDDIWSMILVNKRTFSTKARIFTLAHELGHHLLSKDGVSNPMVTKNSIEKACNEFASRLLATDSQLENIFSKVYHKNNYISAIRDASNETLLSGLATAYRLNDIGLINKSQFNSYIKSIGFASPDLLELDHEFVESDIDGGAWQLNVASDYGLTAIKIVEDSLNNNLIDRIDAECILNARNDTFNKVTELVEKRLVSIKKYEEGVMS